MEPMMRGCIGAVIWKSLMCKERLGRCVLGTSFLPIVIEGFVGERKREINARLVCWDL